MVMNSYEIVKAALYFQRPERLPVIYGTYGTNDFEFVVAAEGDEYYMEGIDQWGCVWTKTGLNNMGQVTGFPVKNLDDVETFKVPDFNEDRRYKGVAEKISKARDAGKYIGANIFMILFERMHSLCRFEDVLCGLLTSPEKIGVMADRIIDAQITFVRNLHERFGSDIDGINMGDDWGTQRSEIISYELWMEFFYPRYKRLFDFMHKCGYDVFVHSCGKINNIIEGFIKAGVNAMNLLQPRVLGIKETGQQYSGRVCFFTMADYQTTLPSGNLEQIGRDVEDLMKYWATPNGGLVLVDYGDANAAIGIHGQKAKDVKLHMYRCFSQASEKLYGNALPEPIMPVK